MGAKRLPKSYAAIRTSTKLSVLGESYKGAGLFENAMSAFKGCLKAMKPQDSERFLIKSYLADIYCELNNLNPDGGYLEKAEKLLSPEINYFRARGGSSKHFRRLILPLIEIEILGGRPSIAESLVKELLEIYDRLNLSMYVRSLPWLASPCRLKE